MGRPSAGLTVPMDCGSIGFRGWGAPPSRARLIPAAAFQPRCLQWAWIRQSGCRPEHLHEEHPAEPRAATADLRQLLTDSAARFGDLPAFLRKHHPDGVYSPVSYRQFRADVEAFGTALLDLGLAGCRVAVVGEHQYAWAVAYPPS